MIDLITRVNHKELYARMLKSAKENACGSFESHFELDTDHKPKIAETYNRLGRQSKADILVFIEDDVEILEKNWDAHLEEIFAEYKPDILGVIGSKKYQGGGYFDSGPEHQVGLVAGNSGVRISSSYARFTPAVVVDGMFLCVSRDYFEKEQYDEEHFYGLFYYDIDLCLRSKKVGVTSLLVKHSKPPEHFGVYPKDMEPISVFTPAFKKKWGDFTQKVPDLTCCLVSMETYKSQGQSICFRNYQEKRRLEGLARVA